MFDGFQLDRVDVGDVTLRVRYGGEGRPVVLLHGHPRTHTTWHRADLRTDRAHEEADRAAGRKIQCPMLLLVSTSDDLDIHSDPETIWRPWTAAGLRSCATHSGHHQAEEAPDELATALLDFLGHPVSLRLPESRPWARTREGPSATRNLVLRCPRSPVINALACLDDLY
jgi:pimeloyl-ACP methyl ester carboxylesterase